MSYKTALILLLVFIAGLTNAATYKWIDEQGNTSFGDSVPNKYKARAIEVEIKDTSVQDNQNQPVIKEPSDKARSSTTTNQEQPENVKTIQSSPVTNIQINKEDNCREQLRKYKESQDCFAPYVIQGGIKEEALLHCTALPKPDCTERDSK